MYGYAAPPGGYGYGYDAYGYGPDPYGYGYGAPPIAGRGGRAGVQVTKLMFRLREISCFCCCTCYARNE